MIFKSKKKWVRFYCLDENVATLYPLIKSKAVIRNWNNLASTERNRPEQGSQTVLNCPAIKLVKDFGYVLTAPADFVIKSGDESAYFSWETPFIFKRSSEQYTFGDTDYYIDWHSHAQVEPIIPKSNTQVNKPYLHTAVKVETPWRIKASSDIVLLQIPVTYNNEERFTAAIGIVDPEYMHAVTVQLFWHVTNSETLVRAGTPLAQYVPIHRNFLEKNSIDFIVDKATDVEKELEDAYAFANHSRFPRTDTANNKIKIIKNLFNYFRKKYPKQKI